MKRITIALFVMSTGLLLVPLPAGAGLGTCHKPATDGTGTTVGMRPICFMPTVLRIDPGQAVKFVNDDRWPHTVTGLGGQWGTRFTEEIAKGESIRVRFDAEGVYPYTCTLHPGMSGAIVVGDGKGPGAADAVSTIAVEPAAATEDPASKSARRGPPWPGFIGGTAVLGIGLGFGIGRLRRRPDRT